MNNIEISSTVFEQLGQEMELRDRRTGGFLLSSFNVYKFRYHTPKIPSESYWSKINLRVGSVVYSLDYICLLTNLAARPTYHGSCSKRVENIRILVLKAFYILLQYSKIYY